ncbi:MAG: class I SAM-dependent methyltransferase [Actinobacteria bacterium]|nr:MAG: class I SAM-dependent methyltransferase [Actinomycetota bacterium]
MPSDARVHPSALAFERVVADYERGRPEFPDRAIGFLVDRLSLAPGRTLLESGAGTGKLTRMLTPSGVRIIAVEPLPAMREALSRNLPDVEVLDAVAEDLPLGEDSVDAAVAAQAFHWFDGDRALAELARVLVPAAPIALVWNVRDESVPWIRELTGLIEPHRGDTPSHRSLRWKAAFDASDAFLPPQLTSFPYLHATTHERIVARVLSISFIAALAAEERDEVAEAVRRLVAIGEVMFAYRTDVWVSRRM